MKLKKIDPSSDGVCLSFHINAPCLVLVKVIATLLYELFILDIIFQCVFYLIVYLYKLYHCLSSCLIRGANLRVRAIVLLVTCNI